MYAMAFMNNARSDNRDRKRLFNFNFPKFMEKKLHEYIPKYDYFKVDKALLGDTDDQIDLAGADIEENPDDDISVDYEENARFSSGFGYNKHTLKAEELDELDDIEAMVMGGSGTSAMIEEKLPSAPRNTQREYEGASSSQTGRSKAEAEELEDLDEEEMLQELNELVKNHRSTTTGGPSKIANSSGKKKDKKQLDIDAEIGDIV